MASKGDTQINSFVGGLVTEASPLTFPENASFDEINFKLKKDGTRERRLGLDYETGYTEVQTSLSLGQMPLSRQRFYRWETPSGSIKVEIGIVQVGSELFFIDLLTANPSDNLLNGGNSIKYSSANITTVFDFTIVNTDVLVVSQAFDNPKVLSYDEDTGLVTSTDVDLKIRDIYGVQDNLALDARPSSLSTQHEYNLRNQGWSTKIQTTCDSESDALECTKDVLGAYPSNTDTWALGKIEDVSDSNIDKYDPETLERNSVDLGAAAKGHFIIDLYNRGASRRAVSGVLVPSIDIETGRITTTATFAGRAFYAGMQSKVVGGDKLSPRYSGTVLFSKTVLHQDDYSKCYQEADPTSTEQSDLVDTDGGVISVPGAAHITKLLTVKQSLFVFAQNGIWEIKGDDSGFKATSFQVNRLTTVGVLSRDSIVETNGSVLYWANEGIFALAPDQFGTSWEASNLTLASIQSLYDSIPNGLKDQVRGYYDQGNNQVRWLYQSDTPKEIGRPVDLVYFPQVFQIGEALIHGGTYNTTIMSTERLTDTKFVLAYNNTLDFTWNICIVNANGVSLSSIAGKQVISTGVSAVYGIKVARISDSSFLVFGASNAGNILHIVDIDGNDAATVRSTAPVTFSVGASYSDMDVISSTHAVVSSAIPSSDVKFTLIDLSSGTPVQGVTFTSIKDTFSGIPAIKRIHALDDYFVVFTQNKVWRMYNSNEILYEDPSFLNTSSQLFQGGNPSMHNYLDGDMAISYTFQMGVVNPLASPPVWEANDEGGVNFILSQERMPMAGYQKNRTVVISSRVTGDSPKAIRLNFVKVVEDTGIDVDSTPALALDGGDVQLLDSDVGIFHTQVHAENLSKSLNTVYWASIDFSTGQMMMQAIQLGE